MDIKTLTSAVMEVAEERGVPKERVMEVIGSALGSAYKKEYGQKREKYDCKLDPKTGDLKFWQVKQVVTEDDIVSEGAEQKGKEKKIRFDPQRYIMLEEAKKINPDVEAGEDLKISVENRKGFGRIAAQVAKQVVLQKIKEVERDEIFKEYRDKEEELVSGIVQRKEGGAVFLDIGKTAGILPKKEQIKGEDYNSGQRFKLYVLKVEKSSRGPSIMLSRVYPKLVSKLFELEVPEIAAEQVEIKSIVREPGSRSKIAVEALEEGIDPIGSMVGQRGTRIWAVINEIGGEKVDVVEWSDDAKDYIANALSPVKVLEVKMMPKNKARAIVPNDQLSLAIGKKGQNVRLAAKLTGWKIDVRSVSQVDGKPEQKKKAKTEEK